MQPKEKDFVAPIIDCFKPNKKQKNGVIGVKYAASFAQIINMEDDSCFSENNQGMLLPRSSIDRAYINDLGGISLGFSPDVLYDGNYLGLVMLKIPDSDYKPFGFAYEYAARVRKVDEIVVWENSDVPEKKKLLRTG